jgi:HPt (histidine-containing phosphotransfer) domain-containing protein
MLGDKDSAASKIPDGRDSRVEALLARLKERSESSLRLMAERLADLPEEQSFGQVEHDLRDLAHRLASSAHQAGLEASQKKGT